MVLGSEGEDAAPETDGDGFFVTVFGFVAEADDFGANAFGEGGGGAGVHSREDQGELFTSVAGG